MCWLLRSSVATAFISMRQGCSLSGSSRQSPTIIVGGRKLALAVLDLNLAQGRYLCADEPTIADLFCYGDVAFVEICNIATSGWPNVSRWAESVTLLPGFKAPFELLATEDAEVLP